MWIDYGGARIERANTMSRLQQQIGKGLAEATIAQHGEGHRGLREVLHSDGAHAVALASTGMLPLARLARSAASHGAMSMR